MATDMNPLDVGIILFLNGFARRSWAFDTFVSVILQSDLIKAGVITGLIWWTWFQPGDGEDDRREFLLSGIVACFLAIVASRILAMTLPFRERPLHNPALHFRLPYGVDENALLGWSSFPSDHAALFFTLATSIFFASRRLGILAFFHAFFVVCLTRIYMGFHYPTDILAGALLGIGFAYLFKMTAIKKTIANPGLRWMHFHPSSFYTSFFLVTLQIYVMFEPLRYLARFAFATKHRVFPPT